MIGEGIEITTGFDLFGSKPVDSKMQADSVAEMYAINVNNRWWSMEVIVNNDSLSTNNGKYYLKKGAVSTDISDNGNWTLVDYGGGGGGSTPIDVFELVDADLTAGVKAVNHNLNTLVDLVVYNKATGIKYYEYNHYTVKNLSFNSIEITFFNGFGLGTDTVQCRIIPASIFSVPVLIDNSDLVSEVYTYNHANNTIVGLVVYDSVTGSKLREGMEYFVTKSLVDDDNIYIEFFGGLTNPVYVKSI